MQTLPPPTRCASATARALDLPAGGVAPQLLHALVHDGEAGRPARVTAGEQPAVGVERDAPARAGLALGDELVAATRLGEPEQLVVLELLVHERVVDERDVDVIGTERRGLVALERGVTRHRRGPDHRAHERVPTRVRLRLQGRRQRPHDLATRLPLPHEVFARQDHARGAVVGRAAHHRREWTRHHPRRQDLFGRDHVVGLSVRHRRHRAVVPALRRDLGVGLDGGAALVHASLRPQREVGRGQDRRVDHVAPAAATRAAAAHLGHLVEAQRHGDIGAARRHRPRRFPERDQTGGRRVLDVRDRQSGEAELLHRLHADHRPRRDVAHHRLVDVGQGHARVVQREQPGIASDVHERDVTQVGEAHHPDAGDRDALELQTRASSAAPLRALPTGRNR